MDVGDLPAVGRVDVVRARRRGAHEVGQRPQQDEVARARPRLVGEQHQVRVEGRVVEEVERRPALLLRDAVGRDLAVEVLRAVDVAGVAEVLVVARRAGERERVVAPDRVLHDLAERVHVGVVVLRVQADRRVRGPHQRPRHLRVQAALDPRVQLVGVEGEEVRALAPGHVDDLDVLALADLVGERRGLVDAEVEPRLGERRRQLDLLARPRHRAVQLDHERGGRPVAVDHAPAGRGDDHVGLGAGDELLARAGRPARARRAGSRARPRRRARGRPGPTTARRAASRARADRRSARSARRADRRRGR